jgi:hypothetical protein
MIGIGATALCLRWGTYLAVLLDEHKPLDPRIGSVEISMISDSEMKRINLEFSANLARLIRMLHEERSGLLPPSPPGTPASCYDSIAT